MRTNATLGRQDINVREKLQPRHERLLHISGGPMGQLSREKPRQVVGMSGRRGAHLRTKLSFL